MELNDFAANYPELYTSLNEYIRLTIENNQINGEVSLTNWDNMVDHIVSQFDQQDYNGYASASVSAQTFRHDGNRCHGRDCNRDRDWDNRDWDNRGWDNRNRDNRCRNGFCDFDLRDTVRILFLRNLFDRRRR